LKQQDRRCREFRRSVGAADFSLVRSAGGRVQGRLSEIAMTRQPAVPGNPAWQSSDALHVTVEGRQCLPVWCNPLSKINIRVAPLALILFMYHRASKLQLT
jgi:hypothetical protein